MASASDKIATIGTFDGVHLGHRHLLKQLVSEARRRGMSPVVVTFREHPLSVIAPERVPARLSSPLLRDRLLYDNGITEVIELSFSPGLRRMTAAEFMAMLRERYGVKALVTGYDHSFGSDRPRNAEDYRRAGLKAGVEVLPATALNAPAGQLPVCSSTIRQLISRGEMQQAAAYLGRPYIIEGTVVRGWQIGRTIGFPTANISPEPADTLIPANGVYEGTVTTPDGISHRAMINIGKRPTVDHSARPETTIEAHLKNFNGDLYGLPVSVEFIRYMRPERKFDSLEALKRQLREDLENISE